MPLANSDFAIDRKQYFYRMSSGKYQIKQIQGSSHNSIREGNITRMNFITTGKNRYLLITVSF